MNQLLLPLLAFAMGMISATTNRKIELKPIHFPKDRFGTTWIS
jgi:hypothetical protein